MTTKTETPKATDATEAKPTLVEALKGLSGFDELAIKQRFGVGLGNLLDDGTATAQRALLYVRLTRTEKNKDAAFNTVMNLPMGALDDEFSDTGEEDGSEENVFTDAGND